MICKNCGGQNTDEALFCNKCGNRLSEMDVTEKEITEESVMEESGTEESVTEEDVTEETITDEIITDEIITEEKITEESVKEEPVKENSIKEELIKEEPIKEEPIKEEPIQKEPVVVATSKPVKAKVKGFKSMKFALGFITILLSFISAGTMFLDMFIIQYDAVFFEKRVNYIKGTDIFKMINDFGELTTEVKNFVIVSMIMMILVIGISLVQFFITILWRTKGGYITTVFLSMLVIFSEAIMTGMFFRNYVMNEYDALGIIGYGPVIAIVSHVIIIIVANVTRKLTKINSIVNN